MLWFILCFVDDKMEIKENSMLLINIEAGSSYMYRNIRGKKVFDGFILSAQTLI